MPALLALVAVTAVWGYTFVPMKDAIAVYPLFAFLAVRFAIAALTLAVPAAPRLRGLGRSGWLAGTGLGLLLALGYALQTAGLERTTDEVPAVSLATDRHRTERVELGCCGFFLRAHGDVQDRTNAHEDRVYAEPNQGARCVSSGDNARLGR